jgi:hypothetical protein
VTFFDIVGNLAPQIDAEDHGKDQSGQRDDRQQANRPLQGLCRRRVCRQCSLLAEHDQIVEGTIKLRTILYQEATANVRQSTLGIAGVDIVQCRLELAAIAIPGGLEFSHQRLFLRRQRAVGIRIDVLRNLRDVVAHFCIQRCPLLWEQDSLVETAAQPIDMNAGLTELAVRQQTVGINRIDAIVDAG